MMGVMSWLLNLKLEELRDDTFRNLTAQIEMPAAGDVMNSFFILSNGGKTRISHMDFCGVHLIVGNAALVGRLSVAASLVENHSLGPGGESQSTQCLQLFSQTVGTVNCADVEFWTQYSLETDPTKQEEKYFRFAGYRESSQFIFAPHLASGRNENKEDDLRYCGAYLTAQGRQSLR